MQFTGKRLVMVRQGIELAISELHNQIATCPDVGHYADDLDALEAEKARYEKLLRQIDRSIAKEQER